MARRLTTIRSTSRDSRFDPWLGQFFCSSGILLLSLVLFYDVCSIREMFSSIFRYQRKGAVFLPVPMAMVDKHQFAFLAVSFTIIANV